MSMSLNLEAPSSSSSSSSPLTSPLEKESCSSVITLETQMEDCYLSSDGEEDHRPLVRKSLSWADQVHSSTDSTDNTDNTKEGNHLVTVHVLPPPMEPHCVRIIVLLMHDGCKKFEFLHVEFQTQERLLVQHVLEQLPGLATGPVFQTTTFGSLIRECNREELLNVCALATYGLRDGNVVVAVPQGSHPQKHGLQPARKLLASHGRFLRKAAKKARIMGRALQFLQNSQEWTSKRQQKQRVKNKKEKEEKARKQTKRQNEKNQAPENKKAPTDSVKTNNLKGKVNTANTKDASKNSTKTKQPSRDSKNRPSCKESFLPHKILKKHRQLMDDAEAKRTKKGTNKRHKKVPFVNFTWIRTRVLHSKIEGYASKQTTTALTKEQWKQVMALAKTELGKITAEWKKSQSKKKSVHRKRKRATRQNRSKTTGSDCSNDRAGGGEQVFQTNVFTRERNELEDQCRKAANCPLPPDTTVRSAEAKNDNHPTVQERVPDKESNSESTAAAAALKQNDDEIPDISSLSSVECSESQPQTREHSLFTVRNGVVVSLAVLVSVLVTREQCRFPTKWVPNEH